MTEPSDDAIAIVGIGCKVPGADNIKEFWRVLVHGENHVVDIPNTRWNADAFYDADPMALGKTNVNRAGLVNGADEFDNKLFGINDFEAAQMDPQQRFVLDCTQMALEDAGLTRTQIAGSNTGVFLGAMNSDYRGLFTARCSNIGNYTVTGISNSIIAARVSYVFDLRGPSLVLDTACSSSLIGIHLGCQAIRTGDCDMAIAGGTNYLTLPDVFVHLSKARMISPTGQCHSFSTKADGYTRGEGCGVVILKRLRDAQRDGDNIWATIYTACNQDGHSVSPITAPSGFQQLCLLDDVFQKTGLDPNLIDYIEAHGTGTKAGDPVEANSLGQFFKTRATPRPRYIGSVKTNIGHLESAAGVIGIIKVLLMMKHEKIVPSLHCEEANPSIDFQDLMLTVPAKPVDWDNPEKMSCCNSFGFGGSNSHALLHYYKQKDTPSQEIVAVSTKRKPCIVCFSACTDKSLRAIMEELYAEPDVMRLNVHDVSYTSTVRRDHYPIRIARIVEDIQDLMGVLEEEIARPELPAGVYRKPKMTFVFCGMGTSWAGMCKELMAELPVFREAIMQVDDLLKAYVDWSLSDRLHDEKHFTDDVFSPIAIFACQVALTAVWRDLGLEPHSIVGQSVGEVAAAYAAGCLSLADAVKIVYHRSRLLATVTGGKMMIVRQVPVEQTRQVVDKYKDSACISLRYSPVACCISADVEAMRKIKNDLTSTTRIQNKGMQLMDLDVPVAYHSHHVDSCKALLASALEGLVAQPPSIPLVSSVTGARVTTAPGIDYWVDNLRQPVIFDKAVLEARDPKHKPLFLEIGPKPVLRAHLADIFPKEDTQCVMSMSKTPEYKVFLQALVALYGYGITINWSRLPSLGSRVTDVPKYVFDKKKNLAKSETAAVTLSGIDESRRNHPYAYPLQNGTGFKLIITPLGVKSVYDHIISGRIVVPGAFYAETGFAIAKHFNTCSWQRFAVSVDFEQAMSIAKDGITEIDVQFAGDTDTVERWRYPIRIVKDNRLLAHLRITEIMSDPAPTEIINLDKLRSRCVDEVSKDYIYNALRSAGFFYGETFSLLDSACTNSNECIATLKLSKSVMDEMPGTTIHPSILDCMLQTSLIITSSNNPKGQNQKDLLPKALGRVVVHKPMEPVMVVYTRIKVRGAKRNFYDIKLLSTSGSIIAELDGLVINLIMETQENALPNMFSTEWDHVMPLPPSNITLAGREVLYLSDQFLDPTELSDKQTMVSIKGLDFTHGLPHSVHQSIVNHRKAAAIVLLLLEPLSDGIDCDSLDQHMLNLSFLFKELLMLATNLSFNIPIYLCTCNAWPSVSPGRNDQPVNPASTGLWGLCRTVLRERIYPSVVNVEFQMPPHLLTMPFVERIFDYMPKETKLEDHSEILITPDGIHINLITIVDPDTPIPMFRRNVVSREKPAILLSNESSALVSPIAVLHDLDIPDKKDDREMMVINAKAYALQSASLLKMKMPYERLERNKASKASGYTVFAVEVVGNAPPVVTKNGEIGGRVAACYPVVMGTQVSVPSAATIRTDLLPDYELGDLTKLVLLFELQRRVDTPRVTILASNRTRNYASLLEGFFAGRKNGKTSFTVNIAMVEQLEKADNIPLHETIVSLVLLDGPTVSSLASRWDNATSLISCSSLLDLEALSCAYCFAPDLDVSLVDTQLLYQPASLKKLVPEIAKFVKKRVQVMPKVMAALHADVSASSVDSGGGGGDVILNLADLLKFQRSEMTNLEVHVNKDELFRKDSSYTVVGGLSGLGWICVEFLAEKGAGHIAIFNRRAPSAEQQADIQKLSSRYSCHVQAFRCDVTSLSSVNEAFEESKRAFSGAQLRGIFFGAAVTADKSFMGMDLASFDKALSPKVRGIWNMHKLTKSMDLDYFIMHSSVASVVGSGGQSNYSMGNAFMDGLAHLRRQQGLSAQAINWGALDTGLLESNDVARQSLLAQGFLFMSPEEIRDVLTPILMLNWPQCSPLAFDREKLSQKLTRESLMPLRNRLKKILVNNVQDAEIEESLLLEVKAAKDYDPEKRLAVYENYVCQMVAQVLSVDPSSVNPDISLLDLGMDSIVAMTMINQIHRDTSRRLPAVVFITGEPTVLSIAEAIDEASEDGESEEDGPIITEIKDEDAEEEPSVEASTIENLQLAVYKQHPRQESLHGTVDIPLRKDQLEKDRVQKAIVAVLARHPSARAVFSEDNGTNSKRRFRRSTLTTDKCFDLRVIGANDVLGESLDSHSCEAFDVHKNGPVRFILVEYPLPMLRVVFYTAAFDMRSASVLVADLTACLESSDTIVPTAPLLPLDTVEANKLDQKMDRIYKDFKAEIVRFWEPKLSDRTMRPSSLKFGTSNGDCGKSQIDSVKLELPAPLLAKLKNFITFHNVTLLGVIGSCYQLLLHTLTREKSIPLVFPLDLRKLDFDINNDMANYCNEIPLIAEFGQEKMNSSTMTLQNFVLTNDYHIMRDIKHGMLPLTMFESLSESARVVFGACVHGVGIDMLDLSEIDGHDTQSYTRVRCKAKHALKLKTIDGTAAMPRDLETHLMIKHLLKKDILTLNISYKCSVLDRSKADSILRALAFFVMLLLTRPNTTLRKVIRKGAKIKRRLARQNNHASHH